jgi:hypothetical protein
MLSEEEKKNCQISNHHTANSATSPPRSRARCQPPFALSVASTSAGTPQSELGSRTAADRAATNAANHSSTTANGRRSNVSTGTTGDDPAIAARPANSAGRRLGSASFSAPPRLMHLRYYIDEKGHRVYTMKVRWEGKKKIGNGRKWSPWPSLRRTTGAVLLFSSRSPRAVIILVDVWPPVLALVHVRAADSGCRPMARRPFRPILVRAVARAPCALACALRRFCFLGVFSFPCSVRSSCLCLAFFRLFFNHHLFLSFILGWATVLVVVWTRRSSLLAGR